MDPYCVVHISAERVNNRNLEKARRRRVESLQAPTLRELSKGSEVKPATIEERVG
jgi:hypothetical protein